METPSGMLGETPTGQMGSERRTIEEYLQVRQGRVP